MGKDYLSRGREAALFIQIHGASLRADQAVLCEKVAMQWDKIDSVLRLANDLATSILSSALSRSNSAPKPSYADADLRRASVHADFVRSVSAIETCLLNGLYGAATTLIRREFEAVNVCYANRKGRAKNRKNPANNPFRHLQDVYRQLSNIAHNTGWEEMDYLSRGSPASLDPLFDCSLCEHLLMCHIHAVLCIAMDIAETSAAEIGQVFTETEQKYSSEVLAILTLKGFLKEITKS